MVRLIFLLLNLLAVNTGDRVTTNIPETGSYSVDETALDTGDRVTTNIPETNSYSVDETAVDTGDRVTTNTPETSSYSVVDTGDRVTTNTPETSSYSVVDTGDRVTTNTPETSSYSVVDTGDRVTTNTPETSSYSADETAVDTGDRVTTNTPETNSYSVDETAVDTGDRVTTNTPETSSYSADKTAVDTGDRVTTNTPETNSYSVEKTAVDTGDRITTNIPETNSYSVDETAVDTGDRVTTNIPETSSYSADETAVDTGVRVTTNTPETSSYSADETAVDTGVRVTTNTPETSSYSADESTFNAPCPSVDVRGHKQSLHVEWDFTCYVAAKEYQVSVIPLRPKGAGCEEDNEVRSANVSGEDSEVTIAGLAPNYEYLVNVTVNTYSGKKVPAMAVASTLEDDPPSPVVLVRGENRSLLVHWNITGCVAADVTGYTVSAIPKGPKGIGCAVDEKIHSTFISAGESETTIPNLAPYYDYEVNVTVHMGNGKQASGSAVASTSEDDPPSPAVLVRGDDRSLHVYWNITGCVAANITGYRVSVIPQGPKGNGCEKIKDIRSENVTAGISAVTIRDLAPYYDYQVNVTANTQSGKQATGFVNAATSEVDPPSPAVLVRGDDRSLHVHWSITGCIAADITGYRVSVIPLGPKGNGCEEIKDIRSENISPGESAVTIRDLAPYYDYQVNVTAKTESGKEATGFVNAATSEVDPPSPAVWVRGDDRSLHVHWNITGCVAADITGYRVSVIPLGPKGNDCEEIKDIRSENVSAGISAVTIRDLAPYYDYQVNVTVNTQSGKQATGFVNAATSEVDPPSPAVWVRGDDRSLHVHWSSTGCVAANITGYTVSVIPLGPKGNGCEEIKDIRSENVSAGEYEVTIPDLAPYYDYQVNVTANTESGKEATGFVNAATSEVDPPSPAVWVRGDDRSLHVHWNITGCVAANITGYTVSVIPLGPKGNGCEEIKDIRSENVSAGEYEVSIRDLAPYYDYQVNVTANTQSGKQATGFVNAATSEVVPPRPLEKRSKGMSKYIEVEWKMEDCVNGNVENFSVSLSFDGYRDENECGIRFKNRNEVLEAKEMGKTFEDLVPYSRYTVEIAAITGAGRGPPLTLKINTIAYAPEPVTNLTATDLNPTNATVVWNKPCTFNGQPKNYKVSFKGTRKGFEDHKDDITVDVDTEELVLPSLRPDYSYTVTVTARNGDLASDPATTEFELPANIPRQTRYLEKPDPYTTDDPTTKAKFTFYRDMFNGSDGSAQSYAILVAESAKEPQSGRLVGGVSCRQWPKPADILQATPLCWNPSPSGITKQDDEEVTVSYIIGENASCSTDYCNKPLASGHKYYVTVRVFTKSTYADAKYVTLDTGRQPSGNSDGEDRRDTAINVGLIVGVVLSLLLLGCCVLISVLYHRRALAWSDSKRKHEMALEDKGSSPLIRQGGKRLNQRRGNRRKYRHLKSSREYEVNNWQRVTPNERSQIFGPPGSGDSDFTVGSATQLRVSESDMKGASEGSNLPRQQQKVARCPPTCCSEYGSDRCALAFSPRDSEEHIPKYVGSEDAFKTPPQRPPNMVLMRRQLEAQPKPVSLTRFPAYSDYLLGVPERISNEYCMLQTFSKDIAEAESCSVALQPENRRKNRYCNILPYDSTRVILDPLPDDPSSDYINASFIRGYSREVEYIASQGPKEDTCFDFWRMVHQHGVKLIIMLTNLQESDRVKCHQYFPSQREHLVFGDITIRCTTELVFPIYTSRTLQLLRDNTQRSIVHLHFREWPDFGCPTNPEMLIHFAQAVRHQVTLMKPCLAVVHCSAGVGRTGTLITIDILLQHIKEHKKVDIFGTVFNLRRQRMFMVQSEPQYVHIYHCIKAALTDPKLMDSEKNSTSSTEPIYANIDNATEPIYANIENGHVKSTELQNCNNEKSQRVNADGEYETYQLITGGSVEKSSQSECEL